MQIIPAIYLWQGNCVTQYKGDQAQTAIVSRNPLQAARLFEKQGARQLHVVHLDERRDDILKMIAQGTSLKVCSADHIASMEELRTVFDLGVDAVALDTAGEKILEAALAKYGPEKIFFTIKSQRGEVEGMPSFEVTEYSSELVHRGVTEIIFRDIQAQGTLQPNFDEVERLVAASKAHLYPFGGIGSERAIKLLQETGATGVIISRAFFEGQLSLSVCLKRFS